MSPAERALLGLICQFPGLSTTALYKKTKIGHARQYAALMDLCESGRVRITEATNPANGLPVRRWWPT